MEEQNIILEGIEEAQKELNDKLTNPTDEDKTALDDLEQDFADVKDKVDEYKDATESIETPEPDTVIVDLPDEFDVTVTIDFWDLIFGNFIIYRMVLASLGVSVVAYILFGKRG